MHLIFEPSLNAVQSKNPQRIIPATLAVLLNHRIQTWPKPKRNIGQVISLQALRDRQISGRRGQGKTYLHDAARTLTPVQDSDLSIMVSK